MSYILLGQEREEFLVVPEMVRFKINSDGEVPNVILLVKSSSLSIRYLFQLKTFKLIFTRDDSGKIIYFLEINDDSENPSYIWSIIEDLEELEAVKLLFKEKRCGICAFNEIAINIFGTDCKLGFSGIDADQLLLDATSKKVSSDEAENIIGSIFENFLEKLKSKDNLLVVEPEEILEWKKISSFYIPNRSPYISSEIHLSRNEGNQQEELALWLVDELAIGGAVKNPTIKSSKDLRELSDIFFSYEHRYFLIESKSLSILDRSDLPTRKKLKKNILKNLNKALKQLKGAINSIKKGVEVKDAQGGIVNVLNRTQGYAIILVPELSLLDGASDWGKKAVQKFHEETGSILQILDPKELLRLVQGAHIIVNQSETITLVMAVDHLLIERAKKAAQTDTPYFDFLIRLS